MPGNFPEWTKLDAADFWRKRRRTPKGAPTPKFIWLYRVAGLMIKTRSSSLWGTMEVFPAPSGGNCVAEVRAHCRDGSKQSLAASGNGNSAPLRTYLTFLRPGGEYEMGQDCLGGAQAFQGGTISTQDHREQPGKRFVRDPFLEIDPAGRIDPRPMRAALCRYLLRAGVTSKLTTSPQLKKEDRNAI